MTDFHFSIDLPVRSEWSNVDLLRTSVLNCFAAIFSDVEGCRALAMVTGELVENAIKYGDWSGLAGLDDQRFRLRVWGEGHDAHVSVENPVKRGDHNAEEVLRTLGWLRTFSSPAEAYRARLLDIAAAGPEPSHSKLGLVRIAYEGNCRLTAELVRGVLHVQAELTV
ncbi:MAG TPA: hypothetical protein VFP84_30030 [Kofleriaceae bacterium]|nr:hypothetical protein [Kofleriaceae bacterium]